MTNLSKLPTRYMITGEYENESEFFKILESHFINGITLVQLRIKNISLKEYFNIAKKSIEISKKYSSVNLILNTLPEIAIELDADGVHLTSDILMSIKKRPLPTNKIVSAACHNEIQLKKAQDFGLNFVTLSPVLHTNTHPESTPLGWKQFKHLCSMSLIPIFALGGMTEEMIEESHLNGAHGIAAISSLWLKKYKFNQITNDFSNI